MDQTKRGAYCDTPHTTIEQKAAAARRRVADGEDPYFVRQDIVNGYSLGFQSANDALIEAACRAGMEDRHAGKTYEIVRYYAPHTQPPYGKPSEIIKSGLTRAEAKEHCKDPGTKCNDYFDGFREE